MPIADAKLWAAAALFLCSRKPDATSSEIVSANHVTVSHLLRAANCNFVSYTLADRKKTHPSMKSFFSSVHLFFGEISTNLPPSI